MSSEEVPLAVGMVLGRSVLLHEDLGLPSAGASGPVVGRRGRARLSHQVYRRVGAVGGSSGPGAAGGIDLRRRREQLVGGRLPGKRFPSEKSVGGERSERLPVFLVVLDGRLGLLPVVSPSQEADVNCASALGHLL